MDDLSDDDISDSQWHDIGESYLTSSQFEDIFSDWSQGDKPENDCIQSDNEVDGLDMDCSESDTSERKRKSSDSELPRYNKVRVIVANPELNDGRAEPEKEKNPKQENEELYQQRHENEEIYEKRHENDSHKVEHKKENIDSDASGKRKSSEMEANVE